MATTFATSYAAITKSEKQEDGSLMVYGKATDDAIDSDNQICDMTWLSKAMPDWFKTGGNIREQHSNIAAGVAKELDSKEDGFYVTAHVVDAQSVKKVEAGVLKGFSIGIRAPRIVRDNKAANGRIIDGQIVEVSLVDRPANPNAKLMLAKSDGTEVIQVEEMIEQELPIAETAEVTDAPVVEEVVTEDAPVVDETPVIEEASADKSVKSNYLLQLAKSLTPEIVKFDKDTFEIARRALAQLIVVEANEMAETGSNEKDSIELLLDAVKHLFEWYENEVGEGEVAGMDSLELSTEADAVKETCACGCDKCSDGGKGCGADKCKCANMTATEKSTITPLPTIERVGDVADEEIYEDSEDKNSDKSAVSDDVINAIVEKAVKSATESVRTEVDALKSAHAEVVNKLQDELAEAKSKAVAGGPKRAIINKAQANVSEFTRIAIEYRNKAAATTDRELAVGYKELAEEFEAKSLEAQLEK